MPTIISPLTGARRFDNGFSIPPSTSDDGSFGEQMYDLRSVLLGNPGNYEREVGDQIQKRTPEPRLRGLPIPWQVFLRGSDQSFAQRDLTVSGGPSTGQNFVQVLREPRIEDALRPYSAVTRAGATLITGLRDSFALPRWETPSTAAAVAETAAVTPSTQTGSVLALVPHRISSSTVISRQLLVQTENMALERLIAKEMLATVGSALDGFALTGAGGTQPLGLLNLGQNAPGSRDLSKTQPPVSFAGPATWSKILSFPASVESTDIPADTSCAWITSPATKYHWANIPKITGFPSFLFENEQVAGFPLYSTNNLSASHRCVYGRWSSMIIAIWSMSFLVDAVTSATSANVKIYLDLFADCGPIYGPGFCVTMSTGRFINDPDQKDFSNVPLPRTEANEQNH